MGTGDANIVADAAPVVLRLLAVCPEAGPAGWDALGKAPNKLEVLLNTEPLAAAVPVPWAAVSGPAGKAADVEVVVEVAGAEAAGASVVAAADVAPGCEAPNDKPESKEEAVSCEAPSAAARLVCGAAAAAVSALPWAAAASLSPVLSATSCDACAADEGADSDDELGGAVEPPDASVDWRAAGSGAVPAGPDASPAAGLSTTRAAGGCRAGESAGADARGVLAAAEEPGSLEVGPEDVRAAVAREGTTLGPPSPGAPAATVDAALMSAVWPNRVPVVEAPCVAACVAAKGMLKGEVAPTCLFGALENCDCVEVESERVAAEDPGIGPDAGRGDWGGSRPSGRPKAEAPLAWAPDPNSNDGAARSGDPERKGADTALSVCNASDDV